MRTGVLPSLPGVSHAPTSSGTPRRQAAKAGLAITAFSSFASFKRSSRSMNVSVPK